MDPALEDLRARRQAVVEQIAAMSGELTALADAAANSNADDEHDPEGVTLAFEREQLAGLLRRTEDQLADLDRAIAAVAEGSYGICEVCGEAIAAERLAARPAARTCIRCARATR